MVVENLIINPFLQIGKILLVSGSKPRVCSNFGIFICAELLNDDKEDFMDWYKMVKINRPKNILFINDSISSYELMKPYEEKFRIRDSDLRLTLDSHLFFLDRSSMSDRWYLDLALPLISQKIEENNIDLVVLDKLSYFKEYNKKEVDEVLGKIYDIVKKHGLTLIIIDNSVRNRSIEDVYYGRNVFWKYADDILYLNSIETEIKMCHLKSSIGKIVDDIIIRTDGKEFYRIFIDNSLTDLDILVETMKENECRFETKGDLIHEFRYKLRSYNRHASNIIATDIVNRAIENGILDREIGTSNNHIITLPKKRFDADF